MGTHVVPDKKSNISKKEQVAEMFNSIAPKYDFLNKSLSLGIDRIWRRKAIKCLEKLQPTSILDIACGTGDLSIAALKLNPHSVIGIDISDNMLNHGREKVKKLNAENIIQLQKGDSEAIEFEDNKFDAAMVAFGVRNFENLNLGLNEIRRVIRPGGKLIVLEFSKPEKFPIKQLYAFYFKVILPLFGKMISKDRTAYNYLPESVDAFPYGKRFENILYEIGFKEVSTKQLSFGIASIYTASK